MKKLESSIVLILSLNYYAPKILLSGEYSVFHLSANILTGLVVRLYRRLPMGFDVLYLKAMKEVNIKGPAI